MVAQFTQATAHCASAGRGAERLATDESATPASARRRTDGRRLLESRIVHPLFLQPGERPPLALALGEAIEMRDLLLGADTGE